MNNNNKPSMNQQDHPHREGQQNNTTPQVDERMTKNNTQQLSDMGAESEEQRSGRSQQEENTQGDERQS